MSPGASRSDVVGVSRNRVEKRPQAMADLATILTSSRPQRAPLAAPFSRTGPDT